MAINYSENLLKSDLSTTKFIHEARQIPNYVNFLNWITLYATEHLQKVSFANDIAQIIPLAWLVNMISSVWIYNIILGHLPSCLIPCMVFIGHWVHSWWRHQTETLILVICAGNSPVTGEFPAQRPVTRSFDIFFDLHLNKRLSKQSWGWWFDTPSLPLWRHCNVYINSNHSGEAMYISLIDF